MIDSKDKKSLTEFLKNTEYKGKDEYLSTSEYRDHFNGERLYNKNTK